MTARPPNAIPPGLVKLVVAGGRLIGAGILAPNAGEMIGLWALAIAQRVKLAALASLIVPYPTRAEAAKRAAGNFFVPRLFAPRTQGAGSPAGTVAVEPPFHPLCRHDRIRVPDRRASGHARACRVASGCSPRSPCC